MINYVNTNCLYIDICRPDKSIMLITNIDIDEFPSFENKSIEYDIEIIVSQEVSFGLSLVKEITYYNVFLNGNEDAFIFRSYYDPSATLVFKFKNIIIAQNNPIINEKSVLFFMPDVADVSFTVEFRRQNQAERFVDFKVIERTIIT